MQYIHIHICIYEQDLSNLKDPDIYDKNIRRILNIINHIKTNLI